MSTYVSAIRLDFSKTIYTVKIKVVLFYCSQLLSDCHRVALTRLNSGRGYEAQLQALEVG